MNRLNKELAALELQVARLVEALNATGIKWPIVMEALSATEQDNQQWLREKQVEFAKCAINGGANTRNNSQMG